MWNPLSFFQSQGPVNPSIKPVMLLILDGWGIAPPSKGNVISRTHLVNIERYLEQYPHATLIASGEAVGLPANEVGNTEVGHLTLGSGRVIYQGLKRINMSIEEGSFIRNSAFLKAIQHVKDNHSRLHLMGLTSSGNVHASLPHFYSLMNLCKTAGFSDVAVHCFTDGRDAPPSEAAQLLPEIQSKLQALKVGGIATISGRFYALDRDRRWDRIEKAYVALTEGQGETANSVGEAIQKAYAQGATDELIPPTVILTNGQPTATINDNDAVIFFNFRIDRPRELSMAFTMPDFESLDITQFGYTDTENKYHAKTLAKGKPFQRHKILQNVFFTTMTNYHQNIPVSAVAFDAPDVPLPLGELVAQANLKQMRMAESEKERFVTYYFNGLKEGTFQGEELHIEPSPRVPTYDRRPEMSVAKQVAAFRNILNQDAYHFFVMNICNPDMVAHTGNLEATIKACLATDKAVGEIVEMVLARNGTVFITADHGNAEEMITYQNQGFFFTSEEGERNTDHSNNPVPFLFIHNDYTGRGDDLGKGSLSDVAPTIAKYLGLAVPPVMTGRNLLQSYYAQPA